MKIIKLFITCAAIAVIGFSRSQSTPQIDIATGDPLDQWNEGPVKTSILSFVDAVTDKTNPNFLPMQDRVAVFDMDGTILLEKPNVVLFDFIVRIISEQIASNPGLSQKQPYKAIYEKDWAYFETIDLYGDEGLYSILLDATDGYTEDQYRDAVLKYFNTVIDNRYHKPYNQLVICSGGTIDSIPSGPSV